MKELLAKIKDLEEEISVLKHQNRRILECAILEKKELSPLAKKAQFYFDNADLAYCVLDEKQKICDVNEAFLHLFGYTKEEVLGLHVNTLFASQKRYERWWHDAFSEEKCQKIAASEYRLRTKSRACFWGELLGQTLVDLEETFSIWSFRDITLRVKSRNTITKLNLKYQKKLRDIETMLDIIPVPVFIKDRYFRYIGCSRAFCAAMGVNKEALIGKTAFDLFPSDFANIYYEKDLEMKECAFQSYKITTPMHLNPNDLSVEIQKKQIMRNGVFDGFVGVLIDRTESEKQEQRLQKRIHEEVEKNLKNQEMYQEERIKNAKFSAIGQMAAGITHEINTPLTYVKGRFEMLMQEVAHVVPKSAHKEHIFKDAQAIEEGLMRLERIIEAMREVSQKSTILSEKANAFELLHNALMLCHNRIKHIVQVRINERVFDPTDVSHLNVLLCHVQKQRIEQVFIIILNNALDELTKLASLEERSLHVNIFQEHDAIVVRFCDNAGGIDETILPRIFEPFESTKESSGIGIGLNIARQIITQHHGSILAYNEGAGAVFEVRLPIVEE